MRIKSITVTAPATISNLGCGFDVMGLAINLTSDELTLTHTDEHDEIRILSIDGAEGRISYNVNENTCTIAIQSLLESMGIKVGINLSMKKNIGVGSGLGSSAASAVAGVYGVNKLLDLKLSKDQLLQHAMVGEQFASNAIHADNVAPSLYGGFILIRAYDPIDFVKIDVPKNLHCIVLAPKVEIKTSEARKIIPKKIPLQNAVNQWGNVGSLIAGLYKADFDLIARSITDYVAEPKRSKLIPGYKKIKKAALEAGAKGCNISGSGPAIFALSDSLVSAGKIGRAMQTAAENIGLESKMHISKINSVGPRVIKK